MATRPGDTGIDLGFLVGAGEGNRTLMTSLEDVPRTAVMGPVLQLRVTGGDRG